MTARTNELLQPFTDSELRRELRMRQVNHTPKEKRSEIARHAAKVRWGKRELRPAKEIRNA